MSDVEDVGRFCVYDAPMALSTDLNAFVADNSTFLSSEVVLPNARSKKTGKGMGPTIDLRKF